MTQRPGFLLAALAAIALASPTGPGSAHASQYGIVDQAKIGCTPCHGGVVPSGTTTQLLLDGLPSEGYVPGGTYELTVFVLGVGVPVGPTTSENHAGFNLQASAGRLDALPGDETVHTQNRTECQILQDLRNCNPATTCGVTTNGAAGSSLCTSNFECLGRFCNTPGTGTCRSCSQVRVDVQATHAAAGGPLAGTPLRTFADGNSLILWQLTWTAPDPGTGDVRFFLAGNAVNGNSVADVGDLWSHLESPLVVPEATP